MSAPRRLAACVAAWPECAEGDYDPRCCRFPKSCSATVYGDDIADDLLEPATLAFDLEGYLARRYAAIAALLDWGSAVGGEAGGRHEIRECRQAIAAQLRVLGVTDAEMSAAVRAGIRARRAARP